MGRRHSRGGHGRPTRGVRRPGLSGTIRMEGSGAVVDTAEGSFRLVGRSQREVLAGDTVMVSLHRGQRGERRALVEGVVERAATSIVGTFDVAGPLGVIRPLDTRIKADFFIPPHDASPREHGVSRGDVVLARIVSYPTRMESGMVTIERRVGAVEAPDAGIWCIISRYDLPVSYPDAAEALARGLSPDVAAALSDPLRRDLRDRFVITVDPSDARDFDDAVSCSRVPGGGFRLGVHIADVSHYVAWGDPIDLEARSRATSVYLADRVLPMLPERLSNDLCSLRADEDRLAMTVSVELDARGRVERFEAYPSVIRSRARLSYDQADALLARPLDGDSPEELDGIGVPVGGAPLSVQLARARSLGVDLADQLSCLDELARLRLEVRRARGAVDFETTEVHALLDGEGRPVGIGVRERTRATSLVEEAMLVANECVASLLARRDLPAAYRVHEPPSPDRLHEAARTLLELGAVGRDRSRAIAAGDRSAMREAIGETRGTGASEAVNALLLRAMMRAVYRPRNEGHYALGAEAYCHFTSPIRRYPDLIVHRVLKLELARRELGSREARSRRARLVGEGAESLDDVLAYVCRHSSERERSADAASRASQKVKCAQYYSERLGSRGWGTVSWISDRGLFVRLDDTRAEGLVRISELGGEWFSFDERTCSVTGGSTGRRYALGDRVLVEVKRADPIRGHIDLGLVRCGRALH